MQLTKSSEKARITQAVGKFARPMLMKPQNIAQYRSQVACARLRLRAAMAASSSVSCSRPRIIVTPWAMVLCTYPPRTPKRRRPG